MRPSRFLLAIVATLAALLGGMLSGCGEPARPTVNLYRAVHSADLDQIKRHLYWGTDVNQAGPDGQYPLHVAANQGNVVVVRQLLQHDARLDVRDRLGRTPLHVALASGKIAAAEVLLDRGADDDLQALLFDLVRENAADRDTINLLAGRGVDFNAPDETGDPPLHIAIAADNLKLVKHLLMAGADVNSTNASGGTPLAVATANGSDPSLIALLRQYGAER